MGSGHEVSFLERCGLTFETMAAAANAGGPLERADVPIFSIRMLNDVKCSDSRRPGTATARGRLDLVRVELRGDLLTIADIRGQRRSDDDVPIELIGARLYALRTMSMDGIVVFMLLTELPPGMQDANFFPAEGCVLMYVNTHKGQRLLKACGRERSSGQCVGFILDAVEA